ncbi:MAG: T9SS type A sorting domain-containing protein [Sphingobacteriales bacterium]|nr:MAG: T9SS type A sorting domain-containing protein [Sphingobacteriales bacterium]
MRILKRTVSLELWYCSYLFLFICGGGGNVLMAQPPVELDFCGVIVKQPLGGGQTAKYFDRFGNEYTDDDFPYPGDGSGAYLDMCDSGYFDLTFTGSWTSDEEETICRVFKDLSDTIANPAMSTIKILIDKTSLDGGALGTGSPIWEAGCGMADSRIIQQLNNIYSMSNPDGYLGLMEIHQTSNWHTIADDDTLQINMGIDSLHYDLYSVALHEALHILGIASQIDLDGSALDDFYSRWDRFIYSVPSGNYLLEHTGLTDCCSYHQLDTIYFSVMPDSLEFGCDLKLAFRDDAANILAPINNDDYTDFTGGYTVLLNKLSHLDNRCKDSLGITDTVKYVMHPGIFAGEIRRIVSDAEMKILCALGYHINNMPDEEDCEQTCEIFTNPETYQIYLSITDTLFIPFTGTGGIFSNDVLPINYNFELDTTCLYLGDLAFNTDSIGIFLQAQSTGIFTFCYTISGTGECGSYCQTEQVTVYVNNSPVETECFNPDCNIICFGDFEGFLTYPDNNLNSSNYYNQLGVASYVFSDLTPAGNTPDIKVTGGDNNVLGIGWIDCPGCHKESASIPLSQPIPDGCTVTVSFNAFVFQKTISDTVTTAAPTLLITALTDYPCPAFPYESINCITPTATICTPPVNVFNITPDSCGIVLQDPIVTSSPISAIINPTLDTLDFTQTPFYTFTWTNNTGFDITTLLLTGNNSVGNFENGNIYIQALYIDNLEATLDCMKKVTLEAYDMDSICMGTIVDIPYILCLDSLGAGDTVNVIMQTNIGDIPGLTVVPGYSDFDYTGTAFVTLTDSIPCDTVTLSLQIGNSFTNGEEVVITSQLINFDADSNELICTDNNSEGLEIVLTVYDCELPPVYCLDMLEFFTVTPSSPNVYSLNEYDTSRLSYSPSSTQVWQPGSHPFTAITGSSPDLSFNVDLVIPTNIQLTIKDMNLFFAPDKRILVKPRAILNLEKTIIDGVCDTMWTGIQVEGPGIDVVPTGSNAGTLNATGSKISNAIIGAANMNLSLLNNNEIANTDPPDNPYINISSIALPSLFSGIAKSTGGGRLNIHNSTMNNCFQDTNVSWNKDAHYYFSNNQYAHDGALWYPFDTLSIGPEVGVSGLWIGRLVVENSSVSQHKYGVRANEADYVKVNDNFFIENIIGVSSRIYNSPNNTGCDILNNEFTNCRLTVQTDGGEICEVIGNISNENGNSIDFYGGQTTAGFYFRGSNILALNNFLHRSHIGIIANQSETSGSLIAGNLVNNSVVSIISEGDNSHVKLFCNHLLDYQVYGLDIRPYGTSNGILPQQGHCDPTVQSPAANTFIPAAGTGVSDIKLAGPITGGFEAEDLDYHDVNATSRTDTDNSSIGDYIPTNCMANLEEFCIEKGFTPYSEVSQYEGWQFLTGGGEEPSDEQLSLDFLLLLADSSFNEAMDLARQYQNRLVAQRKLIPYYIENDSLTKAQNMLNQINANDTENARFKEFNQLLLDLRSDNRTIFDITATEVEQLMEIAQSDTKTGYKAQSVLYAAKGIEFPVNLPELPEGGGEWQTAFKNATERISKLYPNPTNHTATINYNLQKDDTAVFSLYSPIGQLLATTVLIDSGKHLIDVHKYTAGLYFYTVSINGVPVVSDKFVIFK